MYNKKYNYNPDNIFNVLGKNNKLSFLSYLLCITSLILISLEKDFTNLKNGILIIILFYAQLILIVINIYYINMKSEAVNLKGISYEKIELSLRFINILVINTNLSRFRIYIPISGKVAMLACSFILSVFLILYQHKKLIKLKKIADVDSDLNNISMESKDKKNVEHISITGVLLHIYSLTILNREISFYTIALKICAFYFAVNLIYRRLKEHRKTLSRKNLYLIICTLNISFILNLVLAITLRFYVNNISIGDYNGLRDIVIIVSLLFAIPLFREYSK